MTDRIFNNRKIVVPGNLPDFVEKLIDKLNNIDPNTMFWFFPLFVIGALLIKHITIFIYQCTMGDVSQRVMRDVRYKLYDKIQNLSLDYFSKKRTGELVSRITNDVAIIENAVSYGLTDLFRESFLILLYVTIAFSIYWQAALLMFLVFPLIAFPISKIGKKLRKLSKNTQENMADINSHLLETISGIKLVKAFNTENYETERFWGKNHSYYKLKMKAIRRIALIAPMTEIFGAFCGVAIILWTGRIVMSGQLSFGVFILFFGSIMSIISPIKKLGNVNALIQQAMAASDRIYDILDAKVTVKQKDDAIDVGEMRESIRIKDVDFNYPGHNDEKILKGINLEVKKGEIVAIVGPTGTGKTTLVNLIPRFYDPTEGSVTIDGVDVRDVTFRSLRDQIGVVTQETILFNDTVRNNIMYGYRDNPSQEDIEKAATAAFAHNFIMKMPNGYDTVIGDRGFRLSGGEKQRICIARAILKNAPILILDEATSNLDSESEKYVQEALDQLMCGRTVVAIAHRLSTIRKADKILVIEGGQMAGLGKHEELLKDCPLYKRIYEMQFQI
jgi:subfamily B ATP-binding cassette protein MsbA